VTEFTSTEDAAVASVDRDLLFLRGRMSPRWMERNNECAGETHCDPSAIEAVPLLYAISGNGRDEVTVGAVAEWLFIDPSRASRMVSAAIAAGHVVRLASQADGRRTVLELTPAGRAILAGSERFRRSHYARVMADWPQQDRADLARLLNKFSRGLDELG
jgi:DNA-binding MarR family transcriptional regulator